MNTVSLCYLGKHVKTRDYIILQFGRDQMMFILVAPPIVTPAEKMRADGVALVLAYLRSMQDAKGDELLPSQQIPNSDLLKIKKNHLLVEISLQEHASQMLEIIPLHGKRGWQFDTNKDEMKLYPLPVENQEFMRLLDEAFETAS